MDVGEHATAGEIAAEATQAKADRDAIFTERRDDEFINEGILIPTADPHGPDSQDLISALGHWADWDSGTQPNNSGASRIEREQAGQPDAVTQQRLAANEIHNHYMVQDPEDFAKLRERAIAEDTELDLSSADSRLQALDNLTQNTAGNQYGERTCAASALLGAAVLGGEEQGTEGINTLLDSMAKNADPNTLKYLEGDQDNPGVLTDIRKKIADGAQLDVADMHLIQRELYNELQNNETKDANAKLEALNNDPNATEEQKAAAIKALSSAGETGIQADTLKKFIGNSPELKKMMQDKEMGISFIQNDPNSRASNHAVLTLGHEREGGSYTVYDPQLRDDGQIVMDSAELQNYQNAESTHITP